MSELEILLKASLALIRLRRKQEKKLLRFPEKKP